MLFLQIMILLFFILAVPLGMGAGVTAFLEKQKKNILFILMCGYLMMFAGFQVISVPMIIKESSFLLLVQIFAAFAIVAAVIGAVVWFYKWKREPRLQPVRMEMEKSEKALWIVFFVILAIQLFLTAILAFSDGDDAYFVAVSETTDAYGSMYRFSPYTGDREPMDIRHALAPFPILIAFWAEVSGIHVTILSHVALPLLLIPLTYGIYGMLGARLLKGKKKQLPLFMIFVELLIMWGNYSLYTAETFLMTRTNQGKAVLGNLIIPALFLLLYMVGEKLAENKPIEKSVWVIIFALTIGSCLCSLLGSLLVAVLLGAFFLCTVVSYRKWKLMIPIMVCLIPSVIYSGLYILLK